MAPEKSFVYVMVLNSGVVKVGNTRRIENRRTQIRVAGRTEVQVYFALEVRDYAEARMLEMLAKEFLRPYVLTGVEWFKPTALAELPALERALIITLKRLRRLSARERDAKWSRFFNRDLKHQYLPARMRNCVWI